MPTLLEYAQEAINRGGPEIGRVVPITSATATTLVCNALKRSDSGQTFLRNYLVRRGAASQPADRIRIVSSFVGTTGTLTIPSGNDYSDTTATGESVEIIKVDPHIIDTACNQSIDKISHMDCTEFPTSHNVQFWLDDLTWVNSFSDLRGYRVTYSESPQLTRNRYMEKWNSGTTSAPDFWTLSGSGATIARSESYAEHSQYTAAITRAGTDCTLKQSVSTRTVSSRRSLLSDGDTNSLQGESVVAYARIRPSAASQVRIQITDGVDTTSSSYFSDGSVTEATISHTVNEAATEVTLTISVETTNGTVYVDEAFMAYGTEVSPQLARNDYGETTVNAKYSQGEGGLLLYLPDRGFGGTYKVYTRRPYTKFSPALIEAGTADALSSDAPIRVVSAGILAKTFEYMAMDVETSQQTKYAGLATLWQNRFDKLVEAHMHDEHPAGGGIHLLPRRYYGKAMRFGRYH